MSRSVVDVPVPAGRTGLMDPDVHLCGVGLHTPSAVELKDALARAFGMGRLCRVTPIAGRDLKRAQGDRVFLGMLERMDLRVLEANAGSLAAWMRLGRLRPDRVRTDLLHPVLSVARDHGRSVFFLGGRGDEPFEWARRARRLYRGLRIAGAYAPGSDFRDAEGGRRLVDRINGTSADVIVALPSTARGEEFSFRYGGRLGASLYLDLRHGPRRILDRDVRSGRGVVAERHARSAPRRVRLLAD